ncbi:hypothetical protein [Microbacterium sp. NPDC096154]|uniref:hypothetical protein n=1 Tax=Microbacterium sp. NPDC096154 TaxID=3155549 RepID=UPI00331A4143
MADFRAERMPSPEGEGRAKAALEGAWDKYYGANKAVNDQLYAALPFLKSMMRGYTTSNVFDLFGFWVCWRLVGGFDGMQQQFGMSRSSLYRRIALFRRVFGEHPDVYDFPGISVDPALFAMGMAAPKPPTEEG